MWVLRGEEGKGWKWICVCVHVHERERETPLVGQWGEKKGLRDGAYGSGEREGGGGEVL